jgi:hypothetical protein
MGMFKRNKLYARPDIHGQRLYVQGVTVGQVKRAVGKLAKKIRRVTGGVQIIHTHNGTGNRCFPPIFKLWSALENMEQACRNT